MMMAFKRFSWGISLFLSVLTLASATADGDYPDYSDVTEEWGPGVEGVIEQAYRDCFRTYIIDGRVFTVRMPFAQNNERAELANGELAVQGGGKADPQVLWTEIDGLLASDDFKKYVAALADGKEKAVVFDLSAQSWSTTNDLFNLARIKAGAYPGLPHKPYILTHGEGIEASDIYNYIYSIGRLGMDCSGFVWHVLSSIAREGGLDLSRTLRKSLRAPQSSVASLYFGTWYFKAANKEFIKIKDQIRNLQPGDVILFCGEDGAAVHSAVIQSVDRVAGKIRYLQSTDEAPMGDRGVHESTIHFDPTKPETSLKDPVLDWSQLRLSPFLGEKPSAFHDDGERYRAFPEVGGGSVLRLKALAKPIARLGIRK